MNVAGPVVPSANSVGSSQITDGSITLADQANVTPPVIMGRGAAGAGVQQALTPTNLYLATGAVGVSGNLTQRLGGTTYLASTFDSAEAGFVLNGNSTITLAAATVYLAKVPLPGSGTTTYSVTNVVGYLNTKATSTLTHSYAGIVSSGGTLLAQSADNSSANANWSSTGSNGWNTSAMVGAPITITPTGINDFVYVCFYIGTTAGTAPKFQAGSGGTSAAAFVNMNLTAATSISGTLSVADTTTPFTGLTLSSISQTATQIFAALS